MWCHVCGSKRNATKSELTLAFFVISQIKHPRIKVKAVLEPTNKTFLYETPLDFLYKFIFTSRLIQTISNLLVSKFVISSPIRRPTKFLKDPINATVWKLCSYKAKLPKLLLRYPFASLTRSRSKNWMPTPCISVRCKHLYRTWKMTWIQDIPLLKETLRLLRLLINLFRIVQSARPY